MALRNGIASLPSLLTRAQWAAVLVLAGTSLLVFPPDYHGLRLVGWVLVVLVVAIVVVFVGARVLGERRS